MNGKTVKAAISIAGSYNGYAVFGLSCECRRTELRYIENDRRFYCKRCGYPVKMVPVSPVLRTPLDMISALNESMNKSDRSDDLLRRVRSLESDVIDKDRELKEAYRAADDYREEIISLKRKANEWVCNKETETSELHQLIRDVRKKLDESRENELLLEKKCDDLEKGYDDLKDRYDGLEKEVSELESTNVFLNSELQRYGMFDIRGIMSVFMEYAASINNIVTDKDDADQIRALIDARTVQMCMKLDGQGVRVEHQCRGDPVKDGRADITLRKTDVPEQDGCVVRCNRYGCSFRKDLYAPVIEELEVGACSDRKPAGDGDTP